jgi:predicted CXXCH cytochrome family protein
VSCGNCHAAELKRADDSHPIAKFNNPRNADRLAVLDARYCATCHREHKQEITGEMGVTQPDDFCVLCHQDVAKTRPSHDGMAFETCSSAGCHNYHDNKALYEDFLVKHSNEVETDMEARRPSRQLAEVWEQVKPARAKNLNPRVADHPQSLDVSGEPMQAWAQSQHAVSGVNCTDCHQDNEQNKWLAKPGMDACESCHADESNGFQAGKHGMRLKAGLSAMSVSMARLAMRADSLDRQIDCGSCHDPHRVEVKYAAVEACLSCHDDDHSQAYKSSKHFQRWQQELASGEENNLGVSCASCHLPREMHDSELGERILVNHNQNHNLRPNEKMIRSVCMTCHSLKFSIDSLADRALVNSNFSQRPTQHIKSIDMATAREGVAKND